MLNTEQRDVLDSVLRHGSRLTIVQARAGCGKTFVLKALARAAAPRRCLYIVFDSKNAKAAQETFADIPSVTASTVHSLAYRAMDAGRQWGHKMHGASLKYSARYALMGVPSGGLGKRSMYRVAQAVEKALAAWCQSADEQVSESHVVVEREWFLDGDDRVRLERGEPRDDGLERRQYHQVVQILHNRTQDYRRRIVEMAQRWWAQIIDPASEAPMSHDSYLKLWQLSGPVLDYDIILCDEAQDWNSLNIDLVQRQKAQLVVVGDSEQAIYRFRGAIDALQKMRTEHATVLHLTQSYRFGPEVARVANSVLAAKQDMFGGDMPMVRGLASKESRIVASIPEDEPYTLICRGNATAFRAVCRGLEKGLKLHVVGGVKEIASFVSSAYWMQQRDTRGVDVDAKLISHHEITQFDKWSEVVRAAEDSRQLAMVVKLLDENEATILEMLERLDGFRSTPEGKAAIVVTTAHKAKGLEWPNVRLAGDFPDQTELRPGREPSAEELNILYVAATRATEKLVVNAALDALVRKYPVRVRSAELAEFDRAVVPDCHEWPEPPDGPCAVCGGWHFWKFAMDGAWICTGCAHLDPDEPLPAEAITATVA